MIPSVPVTATNIASWIRQVAGAINALISAVTSPQTGQVRYTTRLERYDGTAWVPIA